MITSLRITLATGVVLESSGNNRVLHLSGAVSDVSNVIGSVILSTEDRPAQLINAICSYAGNIGFAMVLTNGAVVLTDIIGNGLPSQSNISGQISWIVE